MLHWKLVRICFSEFAGDIEDVGSQQPEWLVSQNLQEGSTIKRLIYIFPAIVQQNISS